MVGKIKNDKPYYFYKDHLGSTRCVVNSSGTIIAGYDYDAWGYPLENRSFNSDTIKFKFTGKETDKENLYEYFGARYYDGRVANWTSIDPLIEKHFDFSLYNYVLRNSLRLVDPKGKQVDFWLKISGAYFGLRAESDYWNSLSLVGKEEYSRDYVNSLGAEGRVEATGDEMIIGSVAEISFGTILRAFTSKTTLLRAITSAELKSIQALGKYSLIEGVESKYFWTADESAEWFISSSKNQASQGEGCI